MSPPTPARWLAAGLFVVAAATVGAPPAEAAEPVVTTRNPPEGDDYVRAAGPLTGTARDPDGNGILDASLAVDTTGLPDDPCRARTEALTVQTFPGAEGGGEVAFAFPLVLPCNKAYGAVLTVRSQVPVADGPDETVVRRLELLVAVPPAAVTDLTGAFTPPGEEVPAHTELTWAANTEPDLLGYRVERTQPDADAFEVVADLDDSVTALSDVGSYRGVGYRYRVRAVRSGPDSSVPVVASPAGAEVGPDLRSDEEQQADAATAAPDEQPGPVELAPEAIEGTSPEVTGGADGDDPPSGAPATGDDPEPTTGAGRPAGGSLPRPAGGPPVTIDDGFAETLPFDPLPAAPVGPTPVEVTSPPPPPPLVPVEAPPPPSGPFSEVAVTEIDDEDAGRLPVAVPVVGGIVLLGIAGYLFRASRLAARPAKGPAASA